MTEYSMWCDQAKWIWTLMKWKSMIHFHCCILLSNPHQSCTLVPKILQFLCCTKQTKCNANIYSKKSWFILHGHITYLQKEIGIVLITKHYLINQIVIVFYSALPTKQSDDFGVATPDLCIKSDFHSDMLTVRGQGLMGQFNPLESGNLLERLSKE